jgi:NTP pyrophosphatase (non-canonical NTP hydrolase)
MLNKNKEPRKRIIRVTFADNQVFKQMLLDLYDMNVFKTPDELADELFQLGLYAKSHTVREAKDIKDGFKKPIKNRINEPR